MATVERIGTDIFNKNNIAEFAAWLEEHLVPDYADSVTTTVHDINVLRGDNIIWKYTYPTSGSNSGTCYLYRNSNYTATTANTYVGGAGALTGFVCAKGVVLTFGYNSSTPQYTHGTFVAFVKSDTDETVVAQSTGGTGNDAGYGFPYNFYKMFLPAPYGVLTGNNLVSTEYVTSYCGVKGATSTETNNYRSAFNAIVTHPLPIATNSDTPHYCPDFQVIVVPQHTEKPVPAKIGDTQYYVFGWFAIKDE